MFGVWGKFTHAVVRLGWHRHKVNCSSEDREAAGTERSTLSGVKEPSAKETGQRVVIIDGANSIYRAFFAIPHLEEPDKTPTNAVMGFATMLGKVIREESPTAIVVAFDPRGGSFRRRIFEGYKANRD